MITSLKSTYGRLCVLLAIVIWTGYFGQQGLAPLVGLLPIKIGQFVGLGLILLLVTFASMYVWSKTDYLRTEEVVNSKKATFGIALLTIALAGFPGTFLGPLIYGAWSGRAEAAHYVWYAVVGIPIFVLLSIAGLLLVLSTRPKGANRRSV